MRIVGCDRHAKQQTIAMVDTEVEEAQQAISPQYWEYVAQKVEMFEQRWGATPRKRNNEGARYILSKQRTGRDETMMNRAGSPHPNGINGHGM